MGPMMKAAQSPAEAFQQIAFIIDNQYFHNNLLELLKAKAG
jgi:hypothetical protein